MAADISLIEQVVVPHQLTGQGILDATPHPFPHTERVPLIADDHFPRSRSQLGPDIPSHHEFTPVGGIQLDTSPGGQAAGNRSPDPAKRLKKFEERDQLNFTLLADEDHAVADAFGVWGPKKFMGKEYDGIHRQSFLFDEEGKIAHHFDKFKTSDHHQVVLDFLKG